MLFILNLSTAPPPPPLSSTLYPCSPLYKDIFVFSPVHLCIFDLFGLSLELDLYYFIQNASNAQNPVCFQAMCSKIDLLQTKCTYFFFPRAPLQFSHGVRGPGTIFMFSQQYIRYM